MRHSRREQNQNLDSLLDTMANVVGVLVVVMAFTQIQIGQAVRRIHQTDVAEVLMTNEDLARAGEGALHEANRLEKTLHARAETSKFVRGELQRLSVQTALLRTRPGFPGVEQTIIEASLLRETELERSQTAALSALHAKQQRLEVRLRGAKQSDASASHGVRLPDPRPAPLNTEERVFFCRYGRVSAVNLEQLNDTLNLGLRAVSGSPLGGGFASTLLVSHFERHDIGDEAFRWRLSDRAGLGIAARLEFRREQIGELRVDLLADDSRFRAALARADPQAHYLRFYVWSDSFASYLLARELAEEMGFSVGWRAFDRGAEHEGILRTHVLRDPIPID